MCMCINNYIYVCMYLFIYRIHHDKFRPVTADIIRRCCTNTSIKGRTDIEASTLQLKYELIIMLLYQIWGSKLYSSKTDKRCSVSVHTV
jgi:hypothetical protein